MSSRNSAGLAHRRLSQLNQDLRFDSNNATHVFTVALAIQSEQLADSIVVLSRANSDAGILILLRAFMEAATKFLYIAKFPKEGTLLFEFKDTVERLKGIGRAEKNVNDNEIRQVRTMLLARECELKASGCKDLSFKDMLKAVGASDEYYGAYQILSGYMHGQWAALAQGMWSQNEGVSRLEAYKPLSEDMWTLVWDTIVKFIEAIEMQFSALELNAQIQRTALRQTPAQQAGLRDVPAISEQDKAVFGAFANADRFSLAAFKQA